MNVNDMKAGRHFRATVECNLDPTKCGRVKIRVAGLHGDKYMTPLESLPWAHTLSHGIGNDAGQKLPYEVGATVVAVREFRSDNWIILGGIHGTSSGNKRGSFHPEDSEEYAKSLRGSYFNSSPSSVPREFAEHENQELSTLYKSLKGHTIHMNDENGNEFMDLIGHDGMIMRFAAFLTENAYQAMVNGRGLQTEINTPRSDDLFKERAWFIRDFYNLMRMYNIEKKAVIEIINNELAGLHIEQDDENLTIFIERGDKDTHKLDQLPETRERSEVIMTPTSIMLNNGKSSIKLSGGTIEIDCDDLIIRSTNNTINATNFILSAEDTKLSSSTTDISADSSMKISSNATEVVGSSTMKVSGSNLSLDSSSAQLTGSSVKVGGGTVQIGPTTELGASVSKGSVGSKTGKLAVAAIIRTTIGQWVNRLVAKLGGRPEETVEVGCPKCDEL